jgi:hypothetical protein
MITSRKSDHLNLTIKNFDATHKDNVIEASERNGNRGKKKDIIINRRGGSHIG